MAPIEQEFEKEISSKKLSDKQVVALVKIYHDKIESSNLAENTRFTKFSRINIIVKKYYPHLYEQVKSFNVPKRAEKKLAIEERNKFNLQRLENRQEFSYKEILDNIKNLKDSENYYQLVTCALLSTGRRATEVVARGVFEPSDEPHCVKFSGQLKSKDDVREAYEIPVIGMSPNALIALVAKIREMKDFSDKTNEYIASRTNAFINKAIADDFDTKERHVTSESLRCVYAFVAYRLYGNPKISEAVYGSKILGHVGTAHTFLDNYSRVFVEGVGEETMEVLRKQIAEKDKEIASLKKEIELLKKKPTTEVHEMRKPIIKKISVFQKQN
jgi:hypothetical protein